MTLSLPAEAIALALVQRQASDEGLWFVAQTAPEAYLQAALRELHAAVETNVAGQETYCATGSSAGRAAHPPEAPVPAAPVDRFATSGKAIDRGEAAQVDRGEAEPEPHITKARAQAFMDNQPIYSAALAAAGAVATALRKNGVRLCDCGSAPQGICYCAALKGESR